MWLKSIILFCIIYSCECAVANFPDFQSIINDRIENVKNTNCYEYLLRFLNQSISNGEKWPLQMIDATGKLPSGILAGNLYALGDYDECLGIQESTSYGNVEGKFCKGSIPPSSIYSNKFFPVPTNRSAIGDAQIDFTWSICVPHVCSADDLNSLFVNITKFSEPFCQTKSTQPKLNTGDYVAIGLISFIVLLMLASTGYDIYLQYFEKRAYWEILLAFSISTNGRKLFHVSDKPNASQLTCLSGIRSISMMWIILGHQYNLKLPIPISNGMDKLNWLNNEKNMFIIGATVSVDTFLLMAGLVLVYVYMSKPKMKILDIPYYYIHRYLRLTPALAAVIGIYVTLLKHFGDGPFWPNWDFITEGCKYWWTTLLYIENYVHSDYQCLGPTWYLSVDTQLFFLSPLILIPLRKYVKLTLSAVCLLACASIGGTFYVGWHYELGGLIVLPSTDFNSKYYHPTHTRAAPWLIGIIVGYIIYKHKKEKSSKLQWPITLLLWIISLTIMCVCVFCGHDLMTNRDRGLNASYIAFVRPSWALGVAWVIYACVMGYGGIVNTFLSLPVFQILGRLSYTMYLVHFLVIILFTSQVRSSVTFSNGIELFTFWSYFMFVMFVGILWTLAFESPVIVIEKCLTNRSKSLPVPKSSRDIEAENTNIIPTIELPQTSNEPTKF